MSETFVIDSEIRPVDGDRLRMDMIVGAAQFSHLLDRCVEVYLDDRESYTDRLDNGATTRGEFQVGDDEREINDLVPIAPGEADLLRKLGVGGANAAILQTSLGLQADTLDSRWLEAAVRKPDLFTQPVDRWTARRLAAFGDAYMAAMYRTLEVEAPSPGEVPDVDSQIEALYQVDDAIHSLQKRDGAPALQFSEQQLISMLTEADEQGRPYYDPLVLSAKAYPNNQGVSPSCAARMAMVAGFCEAAGWPHMTANTLIESELYVLKCLDYVTGETARLYKGSGMLLHPLDREALQQTARHVKAQSEKDRGFHGCNLVRFSDGIWRQVDTTRGILREYGDDHSYKLDVIYGSLQVGKDAEVPMTNAFNEIDVMTSFDLISEAAADASTRLRSLEEIRLLLRDLDLTRDMTIDRIVEDIILPVLLPDGSEYGDSDYGRYRQSLDRLILQSFPKVLEFDIQGIDFVRQAAREMVTKLAFMMGRPGSERSHRTLHNDDPCNDRCLRQANGNPRNKEYFDEWLRTAPLMFYQKLANDYAKHLLFPGDDEKAGNYPAHPSLEVSSPAIHLAATVLSADSAVNGDGSGLPAAWWQTYDPTHYGSMMHMYESAGTSSLGPVVNELQLLRHLPTDSLLQTTKADRIKEFLGKNSRG